MGSDDLPMKIPSCASRRHSPVYSLLDHAARPAASRCRRLHLRLADDSASAAACIALRVQAGGLDAVGGERVMFEIPARFLATRLDKLVKQKRLA